MLRGGNVAYNPRQSVGYKWLGTNPTGIADARLLNFLNVRLLPGSNYPRAYTDFFRNPDGDRGQPVGNFEHTFMQYARDKIYEPGANSGARLKSLKDIIGAVLESRFNDNEVKHEQRLHNFQLYDALHGDALPSPRERQKRTEAKTIYKSHDSLVVAAQELLARVQERFDTRRARRESAGAEDRPHAISSTRRSPERNRASTRRRRGSSRGRSRDRRSGRSTRTNRDRRSGDNRGRSRSRDYTRRRRSRG